jgi:hypothetical protein
MKIRRSSWCVAWDDKMVMMTNIGSRSPRTYRLVRTNKDRLRVITLNSTFAVFLPAAAKPAPATRLHRSLFFTGSLKQQKETDSLPRPEQRFTSLRKNGERPSPNGNLSLLWCERNGVLDEIGIRDASLDDVWDSCG